jgi:(p)ppGpp synthase/HD superfamily hydrolase
MSDLDIAKAVAAKFHRGQMYGKHDYMYHLEAVRAKCAAEGDDRLRVIAMLHDILEDTDCTEETLQQLFEDDVVEAVCHLTKRSGVVYDDYISNVKSHALARKVKMYDTLCNLEESLLQGDMKRVLKYSKQIKLLAE